MKNCIYTYNGQEYTEKEFKALIMSKIEEPTMEGLFKAFEMKVVKEVKTEKVEEKRFRGVIDALVNRSDIPQEQKDALAKDPNSYIGTLKVEEAVALVDKMLEEYGSIDALLQGVKSNDIPLDLQSIVYWKALNDAKAKREEAQTVEEKDKWADRENELLAELGLKATAGGRFNAFIKSFYQQSGYAMVRSAKKEIERRNEIFGKGAKKKAAEIKEVFDSTEHTTEALEEVVNNVSDEAIKAYEKEIDDLKKRLKELEKEPKKKSTGGRKRLVSKEAKDKAFKDLMKLSANPFLDPEFYKNITTISLYYIEDGYYTIEDFYKKLDKELKGKYREFYGEAYKDAKQKFNEGNPSVTLSTDQEVDSFVEDRLNEVEELKKEIAQKSFFKMLSETFAKNKAKRIPRNEALRKKAAELDALFGTDVYTKQLELYESQGKSVDTLIKEGLIEAGYGKEVSTPNGGTKTVVDWAKVTGSSKSIEPVIDRLKKALQGKIDPSQLSQVLAVIEKQATDLITDKKAAAVKAKVKQLGRRKIGGLLNAVKRKTRIQNLLETWRRGGLSEKAILDQLASEFGIITFTPEVEGKIEKYIEDIDKAPVGAEREKLEEELQAFLNYQGSPNFLAKAYFEANKSALLSGVSTFLQNASVVLEPIVMTPFEILASQVTNGKISPNVDIFKIVKKTFLESLANATDVLLRGGVDMGSSMSEVTGNKEGSPSVRYFENPRAKFQDNPSLFRRIQYYYSLAARVMPRSIGFVETGTHVTLQNMRAFNFLRAQIAADNPNMSSKEVNQMALDAMYSVEMTDATTQAEKEFKDRGIEIKGIAGRNRFNRRVYEIIQQARSKETLREQQRYANEFTYKAFTFGFFSGAAWLLNQSVRRIKEVASDLQRSDNPTVVRFGDAVNFVVSFIADTFVPFIKGLGLWMEKNAEFIGAYGFAKSATILGLRSLGIGKDYPMMEYRRAGETAYRAAVGFIAAQVLLSLIDWEDEEKELKKIYGEGSENISEKINLSVAKPRNTIFIGGHAINNNYLGILAMPMKVEGWLQDSERYTEDDRTFAAAMLNITLDTYFSRTGQVGAMLNKAAKSGDSGKSWSFIQDQAVEFGTRAAIPATNLVRQVGQTVSPQAKKAVTLDEKLLKYSGLNIFLDKPAFDYRGRSYDYGDANTGSLNGLIKSFVKKQPSDEIDNIVFEYNPAIMGIRRSDDLATVWNEEEGKYEAMSDEEFYTLSKGSADNFNTLLKSWSKNFSYKKSNLTEAKFEELSREIEEEEGRLITDKKELAQKVRERFNEQDIASKEGVSKQIAKINTMAEEKAIYDFYVKNKMRIPSKLKDAKENYETFIKVYERATSEQKARFLESLE